MYVKVMRKWHSREMLKVLEMGDTRCLARRRPLAESRYYKDGPFHGPSTSISQDILQSPYEMRRISAEPRMPASHDLSGKGRNTPVR